MCIMIENVFLQALLYSCNWLYTLYRMIPMCNKATLSSEVAHRPSSILLVLTVHVNLVGLLIVQQHVTAYYHANKSQIQYNHFGTNKNIM